MLTTLRRWHQQNTIRGLVSTLLFSTTAGLVALAAVLQYNHRRVRSMVHYKEALAILDEHPQASEVLGEPLRIGRVDLRDRQRNFVADTQSKLFVPLSGPKAGGFLDILACRPSRKEEFLTERLELALTDGSRYLIYERRPTTAMPSMEKQPTIVEKERKHEKRPRLNRD